MRSDCDPGGPEPDRAADPRRASLRIAPMDGRGRSTRRVAIVHYWLTGMRGGEKVLENLCRLFPSADIFTLFYDPERVSPYLRSRTVRASFLNPLRRVYRGLLPLMPMALESFDLRGYDLILSSESGPAKGVLAPAGAKHLCYCHTPMRYLWELSAFYRQEVIGLRFLRALELPVAHYMRLWDYASAARVDSFIANSRNVQQRIRRAYGRESVVVYPPVPVGDFEHRPSEDYYLIVSELTAYKRIDYAIRAFAKSGRRLKVAGSGPEYKRLRALAPANIEFCGHVPDRELRDLYSRCSAFLMPGEEDFGMTMVEAIASGKPVIALGRGGALEIVGDGCGLLYFEPDEDYLERTICEFERDPERFRPEFLRSSARRFSVEAFAHGIASAVARLEESRPEPAAALPHCSVAASNRS